MNIATKCWRHFKTITKHKWYVFIECCKMGIPLQGITHDLSKYSPAEFIPSAKYFQGDRSPIEAETEAVGYSYAWRNHKAKNKHHWQYWIDAERLPQDKKGNRVIVGNPAPMPKKYVKELVCDLIGAGKAYGGGEAKDYFWDHVVEWILHPETEKDIAELLGWSRDWYAVYGWYR